MRVRFLFFTLSMVVMFFSLSCKQSMDLVAERTALLNTDREWAAAAKSGDVRKVFTFWADDAVNYFPGAPVAVGKDAIRELVKKNRSRPGFSLSWDPLKAEVSSSGDLGYTTGIFQLSLNDSEGKPIAKNGNYVSIWKKQKDGTWKCIIESTIFGLSSD